MKKKFLLYIIMSYALFLFIPIIKAEVECNEDVMTVEQACFYFNEETDDYLLLWLSQPNSQFYTLEEAYITAYKGDSTKPYDTTQDADGSDIGEGLNKRIVNFSCNGGRCDGFSHYFVLNGLNEGSVESPNGKLSGYRSWAQAKQVDWPKKITKNDIGRNLCPSNIYQIVFNVPKNDKEYTTKFKYYVCESGYDNDGKKIEKHLHWRQSCSYGESILGLGYYYIDQTVARLKDVGHVYGDEWQYDYQYKKYTFDFSDQKCVNKDWETDDKGAEEQAKTDIEKYCTEGSSTYDEKKCEQAEKTAGVFKDDKDGIDEDKDLVDPPTFDWPVVEVPEITDCESLLGDPTDGQSPAYYLSVAFKVLRYVAIIILIVMSVMDFVGAVSAQDTDAIQKATRKVITRAISCVIIFLLPTLVEFILQFINESTTVCISLE